MKTFTLGTAVQILFLFFLVFAGAYFAKPFLAPFLIALLLSMLFLPLSTLMERKGISRGLSICLCLLILLAAIAGLVALFSTQIAGISEDLPKIKENVSNSIGKIQQYLSQTAGVSPEEQKKMMEQQKSSGGGQSAKVMSTVMGAIGGFLVDMILVFVYIFLLLFFRTHLKNFILKLVNPDQQQNARKIMTGVSNVTGKYLRGLGMMIALLWVMYGIGFSIVGVKNAIFFAILCGVLEIIPFIGNLTGTGLTMIMALSQGGGGGMVVGILITYAVVQFIQTYILEPLVVGSEVNINPLFTIVVIVVGELVWGVPGMVLAIPVLAIVKVICDHIEPLKPYGYLIGEEKKDDKKDNKNLLEKVKGWFGML
jgi:predicted PurR-regulated permease PerM